ncbi:hypothetical protein [Bradyrhizobium sp.]|uniref:hypothetical protein n=1 Tax=Bradyrhizobium sp. TaxID=376 RepID=UPI002621C064|nr:hypothetical protein [Bradyrhizobium sp.]
MTNSIARKLLILCAVVLAVPVLGGVATFFVLRRDIVAKYDACVAGLSEQQRRLPGLESIVDDLKRVERLKDLRWNLNSPYDSGAINILVPATADGAWHKKCGLDEAPADCLAAPHEKFVICNAALGHQFTDQRLSLDIIRAQIQQPLRFLALTFLGHELGHLQVSSEGRVQHLFPMMRVNGLRCRRNDRVRPTEEEAADDFGISVACEAMRRRDDEAIGTDARSAIDTLSYLRQSLDDDFDFDDTCGGDDNYPSVSRRKSTFGLQYAKCMFPEKALPYAAVANDQDDAFKHLEAWLRARQVGGMVGSALYGISPLYRFDVAGTDNDERFVAFDSTGKSAQISTTTSDGENLNHSVLATWDRAGEMIDLRSIPGTANTDFLISFAAANDTTDVRHGVVTCQYHPADCRVEQSQKIIPPGVEIYSTTEHAIVEIAGDRLRAYRSAADYFNDKTVVDATPHLDLQGGTPIVDGLASRFILARRPAEDELPNGLHRAAFISAGKVTWTTFTTAPKNMNPLHAVGLYGQRIAFALQPSSHQLATGTQLWVCPSEPFQSADATQITAGCDVYDPPEDASYSIGIANNDLTSLGIRFAKADYCVGYIVVRQAGWLWLVNPETHQQDILPGTGLVNCDPDRKRAVVYRMRRIDEVTLDFKNAEPTRVSIGLVRTASEPH